MSPSLVWSSVPKRSSVALTKTLQRSSGGSNSGPRSACACSCRVLRVRRSNSPPSTRRNVSSSIVRSRPSRPCRTGPVTPTSTPRRSPSPRGRRRGVSTPASPPTIRSRSPRIGRRSAATESCRGCPRPRRGRRRSRLPAAPALPARPPTRAHAGQRRRASRHPRPFHRCRTGLGLTRRRGRPGCGNITEREPRGIHDRLFHHGARAHPLRGPGIRQPARVPLVRR